MEHALDYRHHYGQPNPYVGNPLSIGQWMMIAAGALAAGGMGYWIYAKVKTSGTPNGAVNGNANGNNANNPMYRAA